MYLMLLDTSYFSYQLFLFCAVIPLPEKLLQISIKRSERQNLGEIIIIDSTFPADFSLYATMIHIVQ